MISRILTVCVSCTLLLLEPSAGAPQPVPQRSVQLGGAGPRPVGLPVGGPVLQAGGPIYTQQLAFGGPPPQGAPIYSQQPGPSAAPPQGRIRIAQGPQGVIPGQPPQQQSRPLTLQPFPGSAGSPGRQPIVLKSPSAQEEEEYEDEEYEDEPGAQAAPIPSPRPTARGPIRTISPQPIVLSQGTPQPGPGPQRFVIPQQQQQFQPSPQQQISRRPSQPQQQARQPVQQQLSPLQSAQPARALPAQSRPSSLGQDSRLKNRASTPPPVQTLNRYMRNNPDGSITWGYENEDGTFKEETLGADCVVRGKYGYVDPDGNKREYEYQQGNPCDPNKKDEPEEDEEVVIGGPSSQQKLGGILTARPGQLQANRRPVQLYQN